MTARRHFGSVRKLPSGRYQASYWHLSERHLASVTFPAKADAAAWLSETETQIRGGQWIDPAGATTTVEDWSKQWWSTTVNLRPSSRARDRGYLDRYVLKHFAELELGELSQIMVKTWVADLSASGLAPATVTTAYQTLSKLMQGAVDAGLIVRTPCRNVSPPRVERTEMRFLTAAEVGRLADTIAPEYRAFVLLGAYGGLRVGELAGLKRHRVDLLRRRVDVAEILVEVEGHLHSGPPKTRAGRRSVAIPGLVADALTEHLEQFAGPEYVFTAP